MPPMTMSLEDLKQKICCALDACCTCTPSDMTNGCCGPSCCCSRCCYVRGTFPDDMCVVVERMDSGQCCRLPYTVADDGTVKLGAPQPVQMTYEAVGEAVSLGRSLAVSGAEWEARILKFGLSKNGWLWTRESAEALLPHLTDAPVGCYVYARALEAHADPEAVVTAGGALVRNIVGDIQKPRIEADGVYGVVHIHEDAEWLRKKLLALEQRGVVAKMLGLSLDSLAGYVPVQVREGAAKWIKTIKRLIGVDIVTAPSADGRFIRATAGPLLITEEEDGMRQKLLALIRKHRPQLLEGRVAESLTEAQLEVLVEEALKPPATPEPELDARVREMRGIEQRFAIRDTQALVSTKLAASKLPDLAQGRIRKHFEGRVAEAAAIDAAITEEREYLAKLSPSGEVRGFGAGRVVVVSESVDRLQTAMDRLFGLDPSALEHVHEAYTPATAVRVREAMAPAVGFHKAVGAEARFRSLKEAYIAITGDLEVRGQVEQGRVQEAVTSATWPNILGNTLYRVLLATYAQQDYGERNVISIGRAEDFRTKEATRLKYFGDLDTVDPEVADYQEINAPGDEKVSYAVAQKGNLLNITRKTIINDDLRTVSRLIQHLGRAARRTFARFVWNFFINNSAYDVDGTAWFHADHGNLLAVALSSANLQTAITYLMNQTEPGSAEKLGLKFAHGTAGFAGGTSGISGLGVWLAVPTALWATAVEENGREYLDAIFTPNPMRHAFGPNGERIVVNPLFTDANDWGVFRDPSDVESIVVDFLQGREEPELFLADQPTVGQTFLADKLQYKIRHEYGGDIVDYRGAVKSVVA